MALVSLSKALLAANSIKASSTLTAVKLSAVSVIATCAAVWLSVFTAALVTSITLPVASTPSNAVSVPIIFPTP